MLGIFPNYGTLYCRNIFILIASYTASFNDTRLIFMECDVCENLNRVRKCSTTGYDRVFTALSLVGFGIDLD